MASNNITNVTLKTYDKALLKKFRDRIPVDRITNKPVMNVVYAPVNLAFEYAMKRSQVDSSKITEDNLRVNTNNQIVLPMISIYRNNGFKISNMTHEVIGVSKPIFYVLHRDAATGELKMRNVQRIFVDIPYQLDIWTDTEEDAAEVVQSVMFLLKREQNLNVQQLIPNIILPSGEESDISYLLKITLDNNVDDNSELESESDQGKLYRYTLTLMVEDAILVRDAKLPYITSAEIITNYTNSVGKALLTINQKFEED